MDIPPAPVSPFRLGIVLKWEVIAPAAHGVTNTLGYHGGHSGSTTVQSSFIVLAVRWGVQMKLRDIGERELLRELEFLVDIPEGAVLGLDEDASEVPLNGSLHLVVNVDTFVSSTDRLPGMTDAQVGRKTAVMVLSDIVAKGARPIAAMLSVCVPAETSSTAVTELVRGYSQFCTKSAVLFLGGDMGCSEEVTLTGVGIGTAVPEHIVRRGGAAPGDVIAVSGLFGLTSVAFKTLLEDYPVTPTLRSLALEAAFRPEIHIGLVEALAGYSAITSCMDSSDGLAISLVTMAGHSGFQFLIDDLPVADGVEAFAERNGLDLFSLVMHGGEEFVLVMTVPPDQWDTATEVSTRCGAVLTPIGRVREGTGVVWQSPDGPVPVDTRGYDSFRTWS